MHTCSQDLIHACDLLIQVAMQCDHSIHYTHHRLQDSRIRVVKIFYKLMLKGKLHAAVCLVTEHVDGSVLDPDAMVTA